VFSTKVEVVRVDVLATDSGRPVLGLGATDFEVLDNGVPQDVEFVSYDQIPLNVVLAFDMSESVAGERLEHLRSAGTAVLAGLKRNDQAALVAFNNQVMLGAALTGDLGALRKAIEEVAGAGDTSARRRSLRRHHGRGVRRRARAADCLQRRLDTLSWLSSAAVLDTAKRSDVSSMPCQWAK
jgi:VWFA-related protein